jgi:hypothetical protein
MHHLDLGLYHYQIEFTKQILKESRSINKFNRRVAKIPRHPGLKIFSGGLQSIARLTANEYRDLMKVMVFVVDDLIQDKNLSEVYVKWNEILIFNFKRPVRSHLYSVLKIYITYYSNLN